MNGSTSSIPVTNISHNDQSDWLEMPKMDNFVDILSIFCSIAVIFGGLVPYIPQYLKIKKSMSSDGFSTYVCLTLLLANILRICFWFGHHFELPLLIQSFVMIAGMLAMMDLCVRVRRRDVPFIISTVRTQPSTSRIQTPLMERMFNSNSDNSISYSNVLDNESTPIHGLRSNYFWGWDDLLSYIKFLSLFTLILTMITYLLLDNYIYIETLGFVAVFTESMLGIPQLLRNFTKKSTRGMSVEMVIMWLSGDLFKTLYFIFKHTPTQFIVCGGIQVTVDILILLQVFWYQRPRVNYNKLPKTT